MIALRTVLFLVLAARALAASCETWQPGYTGADANGPHVLGYWRFDGDAKDSSGKANDLKLDGALISPNGKRDGALESFPGWPVEDKRHAAVTTKTTLSPKGAFSVELWFATKPELTPELSPVLIDKKYVAHSDYQFRLTTGDKAGTRRLQVILGFGNDSDTLNSEPFQAAPGMWQHVAFTYDAAGTMRFFRNGAPIGIVRKPGRGAVVAGKHQLSIGDRVGSNYAGFPGFIDEVRICDGALEFRPIAVSFEAERWTWLRMEKAQPVGVIVRNLGKAPAKNLTLRIGAEFSTLPELAPSETHRVDHALDTSLRPDTYRLTAKLDAPGDMPLSSEEHAEFIIAPRRLPRMPVVMWGIGGTGLSEELVRLKDLGFTHCLAGRVDYGAIWSAKKPVAPAKDDAIAETKAMFDLALANDFGIAFQLSPGGWLKERPDLQRVDRSGKPYASRPDVNAALPGLAEFCENVGASIAQTYRDFPAWQAAMINTEVRDSSQVSFSEFDREAYRKFSGADIPAEVTTKGGLEWSKLKDCPADRVIPDDHPVLNYYRWFWTVGDGWNALHTAVHRGIHSTGRDDVWTWFDPAIRAPSIVGSGGGVDVLGQWTYTNPDPLRIAYFTDELLAMAAPHKQRVMKMTQLFWYRTQSAPRKEGAAHVASPFEDHDPDAAYITISPMHLRESFWTKLARPIDGIMYHGWQALVPTDSTGGYRYTHPDTKEEFRRLHREVLEPLGPTLRQVGDRASDVAYLDSFTAQMFARRGSYGYSNDEAYLTLLYAQLQPQVIHEVAPLDRFKVLVLADCDVLTASVAMRVREFQQRGGIIIGDENLAPAIKADIVMRKITRTKKADADHAALLANAAKLRAALDAKYTRHADSSNPEVVVRCREAGAGEYVFVVNDRREFGDYVGQHGLVMENGLPSVTTLRLQRAGHVYDLVASREVKAATEASALRWPVSLGPCDGRVFLVTPQPIASVDIAAPESVARGAGVKLAVRVLDAGGAAVRAVIPLHVQIADPAGRIAEFSGYHAATDGALALTLDIARNDAPGVWTMRVRELASGIERSAFLRVNP
ncbi:MAG: LamG domain-containing protein [Chthoniobacteraceae bacterium]